MTTHSEHTIARERTDPMVEALIKGLLENAVHPKLEVRANDALTTALLEASMVSFISPTGSESQASLETAVLAAALAPAIAAALAPALAEVLAPALADALAPALEKALSKIVPPKRMGQEPASQQGSGGQEGQGQQEWHEGQ